MNAPADPTPSAASVLGVYRQLADPSAGQWIVSRSERAHMYRIQHHRPDGSTSVDTVVDADNLDAKLHKWVQEGFVRRETGDHAAPVHRDRFMQDLRHAHASRPAATGDAAHVVQVGGVPMPRGPGGPLVPPRNPAYLFTARATDVLEDIVENRRILLIGHTGTGKTSLIEQAAALAGHGVLRSNMNGQTTVGDFVGFWTVKGGETRWVDGVLPTAMREGLWLIVDEIDFAEPAILAVLTAVLEPAGRLLLKEKGNEIVVPHPSFRLFATANAAGAMGQFRHLYQGANVMNEAFLDRWRVYRLDYLPPSDEARVLQRTFGAVMTEAMAGTLAAIAADCRAAFVREDLASAFSTRRLIDWADLMLRTGDPEAAAGPTIYAKVGAEDADLIRSIIRHYIDVGA
ncbi:ATP-binding protein [Burkholderia cepacia]|uniref:ATP-binding protein n=1 Tax=Burkholderia cepacia TaxID=292 RepID=UPI0007575D36|nr:AAA family ATPase [Burkholderia cepacia]KVL23952.1 AAA family ATPase [Burkholderia cepacia]KVQ27651.1 AAA family ATPase [Burkholderia cepacia]MCA8323883.1 AAA family ATPase [Burkholderia cepacia]